MKQAKIDIRRLIVVIFFSLLAIVIASLTIGQDILEHNQRSLFSFVLINFSAYLVFFLFMPAELVFIFYLRIGYDPLILIILAIVTSATAQTIDYLIGFYLSSKVIDRYIGHNRTEKAEAKIQRYGNRTLFISNILPLSSPVISLAAGMLKYKPKDALIWSLSGIICRYILLFLIFSLFDQ